MTIQLQRIEGTPMAQRLAIRSHEWVVDGTAAEGGVFPYESPGFHVRERVSKMIAACACP